MLIEVRNTPKRRSTALYSVATAAPRPVASPDRLPRGATAGSSAGGSVFFGQAAAKQAVMTPTGAVLLSSAAALLAYSVTKNAFDSLRLMNHPLMVLVLRGGTIKVENSAWPLAFFTVLK